MKKLLCLIPIVIAPVLLYAQNNQEPEALFADAEYYRMNEEYTEAVPLYQRLMRRGYDHAHLHYLMGRSYLNIDGRKSRAIDHLKTAAQKTSPDFRAGSLEEKKAPRDALFYLGKAYQIQNQLDTALHYYNRFLESLDNKKNYNLNFVHQQIRSCKKAKSFMQNPLDISWQNLGVPVNDGFANTRPVVNAQENRLVYTSELKLYDAIFMARKDSGRWNSPVNLAPQIRSEGDLYPCDMSPDGQRMVLFRYENSRGNLYLSDYNSETGEWQKPYEPKGRINTRHWETHGCLGPRGNVLYFTSNRRGGEGKLDIYVSRYNYKEKRWTKPKNLGKKINTPYNEETPFITRDGTTLYFSSQGHEGIGGFDVFKSTRTPDGDWSEPVNMGYPISTTDDDRFFHPVKNGRAGYISRYGKDSHGGKDIYRVRIPEEKQ